MGGEGSEWMGIEGPIGNFSDLDLHFARFLNRLAGEESPELFLAAALTSALRREGHVCLNLSSFAGRRIGQGHDSWICPDAEKWAEALRRRPVVGEPGDFRPLILEGTRLYLYRYWNYEQKLACLLLERAQNREEGIDEGRLREGLARLFDEEQEGGVNWQKLAAFASVWNRLCVISGGPGTGKTFTVAKILALHLEQRKGEPLRVALSAPTGKAAARLKESIHEAKSRLNCSQEILAAIPEEASTIHRLLGAIPHSPDFRHNAENPLPLDLLVVDESSMVDLALLSKLLQAAPKEAHLILLGDKDQLASVEAGAVLGDICGPGERSSFSPKFSKCYQRITGETLSSNSNCAEPEACGMGDSILLLRKSYRFGPKSGIGALSQAVKAGEGDRALGLLQEGGYRDISWKEVPPPEALGGAIAKSLDGAFPFLKALEPEGAFKGIGVFGLLSPLREGPYGIRALNLLVEAILDRRGDIRKDRPFYHGRPILITRNDYLLRLFNGDVGLILPDARRGGELRAFFSREEGDFRGIPPLRLPEHETAFALTVHKSQGSEFDRVLLILPDRDLPILTRELIYTAITRAREKVEIWGKEEIFRAAVSRRIERTSGLAFRLWGSPPKKW
jgi:exodeoxyribonuclease V alpha subunit